MLDQFNIKLNHVNKIKLGKFFINKNNNLYIDDNEFTPKDFITIILKIKKMHWIIIMKD